MNRTKIILLVALGGVALLVGYLAISNRQPPMLPADADHATFSGAEECMICHGLDGPAPQSRNHPLGQDCLRCHGRR